MRLSVLQRDEFSCQRCCDAESTLTVHHLYYEKGKDPWEYPLEALLTLCESCHTAEHEERHDCERQLLGAIKRKGFSFSDVQLLAAGFSDMKPAHLMEVVASAYAFALRDPDMQRLILESFFNKLRQSGEEEIGE